MTTDKSLILREIRRLTAGNNGRPPGRGVFERGTGIKMSEWSPHIWLRWSEAQSEAGYGPTQLQTRMSDETLRQNYVDFIRELNRLPVIGEIRRKVRNDKSFPSHTVFSRFGGKEKLIQAVLAFCENKPEFNDISAICAARKTSTTDLGTEDVRAFKRWKRIV
jgi:hypothetical protein